MCEITICIGKIRNLDSKNALIFEHDSESEDNQNRENRKKSQSGQIT